MKKSTYTLCRKCLNMSSKVICDDCEGKGYIKEGSDIHKKQLKIAYKQTQAKRRKHYARSKA